MNIRSLITVVTLFLCGSIHAWESPDKNLLNTLGSCSYPQTDWYKKYFEAISVNYFSKSAFLGMPPYYGGLLSRSKEKDGYRYKAVEPLLVSASHDPRALIILGQEQFVESARLINLAYESIESSISSAQIDALFFEGEVLLNKAIENVTKASNKGDINADTLLAFWNLIGLTNTEAIPDTLLKLEQLAKSGVPYAQSLYVWYRSHREWDFNLERIQSSKGWNENPMGYYKCENTFVSSPPAVYTNLNQTSIDFGHESFQLFWEPLGATFVGSDKSTCVHLFNKAEKGFLEKRTPAYIRDNCWGLSAQKEKKLIGLLKSAATKGDPTAISKLAKMYLEDNDPSNDIDAISLLKLNTDVQPVQARKQLITAYSTVKPDWKACIKVGGELIPFQDQLSKIDERLRYQSLSEISVNARNNRESVVISMGHNCVDPEIIVNSKSYRLQFNSFHGATLRLKKTAELVAQEFVNVKGRGYSHTHGALEDSDYSSPNADPKMYSTIITGSAFVADGFNNL